MTQAAFAQARLRHGLAVVKEAVVIKKFSALDK